MTRTKLLCRKEKGAEETETEQEKLGLRGGRKILGLGLGLEVRGR